MLATLLAGGRGGPEPSKTPFYICASALVAFALLLVGGRHPRATRPSRPRAAVRTALIAGRASLLVAGTMFTAVITGVTTLTTRPPPQWG